MKFVTIQLITSVLVFSETAFGRLNERVTARRGRQSSPINRITEGTLGSNAEHNSTFSSNWAGAVLTSAPRGQRYATAVGTFTIPDPKSNPSQGQTSASASAWVGIDGDTANAAILQAGIDFTVSESGDVTYDAWNEFFPTPAEDFTGFPMAAGDSITVTIQATSPTSGTVTLDNNTQQKSVSKTLKAPSSTATLAGQNAEWIVEDFSVNGGLVNFVDFGKVPFTECSAITDQTQTVGLDNANIINIKGNDGSALTKVTIQGSSAVSVSHL